MKTFLLTFISNSTESGSKTQFIIPGRLRRKYGRLQGEKKGVQMY